jgi:hypothetical protein
MVDDNLQNPDEIENPEVNEDDIPSYNDLKTEEPERVVAVAGYKPSTPTESEEEEESEHKTDIQAILLSLTPRFKNKRLNELVRSSMVSRIPPDNFTDKHFLLTAALIEEQIYDDNFDPVGIISQTQDALLIGFEGRGIADRLEIAGVAHEQELDKLSKELGMAS